MFKIKDAWQIVENTEGIQTFTDVDGQQYRYKQFGTQIWMIDNYNRGGREGEFTTDHNAHRYNSEPVKTFRYKDVLDYQNWNSEYGLNRGAIYTYGNSTYGYVTDLIPSGWHIATQSDWETLISWANTEYPGFGLQALMAKTTYWCPQNPSSSVVYDNYDKSGFGIVPAGRLERSNNVWQYSDSAANSKAYFIIGDKSVILIEQAQNSAPAYSFPGNYSNWTWGSIRLVKDGGVPDPQPIITDIVTSLDSTGSDNKIATEKATRTAITNATSSKMSNPMTAAGDIIVGGASGTPSRLASGTTGQVLKVGSNGLEWGAESGQTLYLGAFDSQSRPQSATTGQFILDTDLGYIIYRYGDAWINSTGAIIEGNVQPSNDPVDWIDNPMTSIGDLIVGGTSGQPQRLGVGTEGQVLSVNSSGTSYWRSETDIFNAGHPMTDQADMMVASSNGTPIRFAAAGDGSFLKTTTVSGVGKILQWAPVPVPSVQTFPLSLINNCQPSGTFDNNMNLTKTYSPVTKTVSRMGFFHKSGTRGTIGLGIYSASGTKLVSTAMTSVTSATEGHICWINLENSFTLSNGDEYWFAMVRSFNGSPDWSSNIEFGHNTTITGATNSISIQYYLSAQPVTSMPDSITATQEGQCAIWIVAD